MERKQKALDTVEEFDDVGEVHVIVDDDFAVKLDERQRDEEHEVRRAHVLRHPDRLPHPKHVLVHQLCQREQAASRAASLLVHALAHKQCDGYAEDCYVMTVIIMRSPGR